MGNIRLKYREYTPEQIRQEALKYESRVELSRGDNAMYQAVIRRGMLDEISSHMENDGFLNPPPSPRLDGKPRGNHDPHNFFLFDEIDDLLKAYWHGVLCGDGYISCNEDRSERNVQLELKQKKHVEKFKRWTGINNKITKHTSKEHDIFIDGEWKTIKESTCWRFAFSCKRAVEALIKNGCGTNKSFSVEFPTSDQVPPHLLHSHVRGLFDADGAIMWCKRQAGNGKSRWGVSIIGSVPYIKGLLLSLNRLFGEDFKGVIREATRYSQPMATIRIFKEKSLLQFLEWIYEGSTEESRLDEKYDKSMEAIKWLKQKIAKQEELDNSEIILKNPDGEIVIVKEKDWVDFYKKVLGYKSGNGPCALRNGRTKKTRRKDHEGKKGWIIVNIEEVSARETRGRNQNY